MKRFLLLLAIGGSLWAAPELPPWLKDLQLVSPPKYPSSTSAVVLWNEQRNVVEESGRRQLYIRRVVKVLTADGRKRAHGAVTWEGSKSKVTDARAWLIQPSGKFREIGRKEFTEGQTSTYELYDTGRFLAYNASRESDPGTIFAYEFALEMRTVFSQFEFEFQDELPHLVSRFQLTPPSGWSAEARGYQGAKDKPEANGSVFTWEMRNLPPIEREPASPGLNSLAPRIAVSMIAPANQSSGAMPIFRTWQDVSEWKSNLVEPQVIVNSAIEAKARELTAGKQGDLDKIKALAEFAQGIRYVAISINTAMGGGYVPRRSDEVLTKGYGDCKDKANLLRALLRTQGIESYPVAIYSGDPRFTREDWPSPHQFNHAILAIRLKEDVNLPAVQFIRPFGRMLLFDPTDAFVSFGYLPDHEQGSFALLMAGDKGSLFVVPETMPNQNQTVRSWKLTLQADGKIEGEMEETSIGQDAFDRLQQRKVLDPEKWRAGFAEWLGRAIPGAEISDQTVDYDAKNQRFQLKMRFKAASYAQVLKEKLWSVRSAPASFRGLPNVNRAKRELPLVLPSVSFVESIDWQMPATLKLDEIPGSDTLETKFGKLSSSWKADGSTVHFRREVEVRGTVLEASDYSKARDFIGRFHGAEVAPIVLLAK